MGEGGEENSAFLVGGFPPWVRKLKVDAGEALGCKQEGDIASCVELKDLQVKELTFLGAVAYLAGIFFTPLKSDIGDMGVGLAISEGEASHAAAYFQLKGAREAENMFPVWGHRAVIKFKEGRLWTQGDT